MRFATDSFKNWLRTNTDLTQGARNNYAWALKWFVKEVLRTPDPSHEELEAGFEYVSQEYKARVPSVRRSWALFMQMKEAKSEGVLRNCPKCGYALSTSRATASPMPQEVRTWVRALFHPVRSVIEELTWGDVVDEGLVLVPALLQLHKDKMPQSVKGDPELFSKLRAWAAPLDNTFPLIPIQPGSRTPYPVKRLFFYNASGPAKKKQDKDVPMPELIEAAVARAVEAIRAEIASRAEPLPSAQASVLTSELEPTEEPVGPSVEELMQAMMKGGPPRAT